MATRRDSLEREAVSSNGCEGQAGNDDGQDSALLYAGRPLSYWAQRVNQPIREAELEGIYCGMALAEFGEIAVPYLIEALKDERPINAILQLEALASPGTIHLLVQALRHNHSAVRFEALGVLDRITNDPGRRTRFKESLKEALVAVAEVFQEEEPGIIRQAEDYLQSFAHDIDPSFPLPAVSLDDESALWREIAVRQLASRPSEEAIPLLASKLDDRDESVRQAAAEELAKFSPGHPCIPSTFVDPLVQGSQCRDTDSVLPALMRAAEDDDLSARWNAVSAFEQRPDLAQKALPQLLKLFESGEPCGKVSAALILAGLGKEGGQALPLLRQELHNPDPSIRLAAAVAVAHIQPDRGDVASILVTGLDHPDLNLQRKTMAALETMGEEAKSVLPRLIECLNHHSTQSAAALVLSYIGPEAAPAIPSLIALLRAAEPGNHELRRHLTEALASIGPEAVQPLLQLLDHPEVIVRTRAMRSLGLMATLGYEVAGVPRLAEKLATGFPPERIVAAEALGKIGSSATPALRKAVNDRDLAVRREAIRALKGLEPDFPGQASSHI
jgi:HEAT repeat protein